MIARDNAILALTPAADHTGKEGYFVELTGGEAAIVNAATDVPHGVILEGFPVAGAAKDSIAISAGGFSGTVKVKLSGAVSNGDLLELAADGTVVADSGAGARVLVAQALEDGADEELIEAVLFKPEVLS